MKAFAIGFAVLLSTNVSAKTRSKITPPIPGTPSAVTATPTSASSVHLTWTDNTTNESGFRIERSTGTSFVVAGEVAANVTEFEDVDLPDNTTYIYRVSAFDTSGATAPSSVVTATTPRGYFSIAGRVVEGNDFNGVNNAMITVTRKTEYDSGVIAPGVQIPDNNTAGVVDGIDIQSDAQIESVTFALKITHSYPSDMIVKLIHPDGTAVILHNKGNGSGGGIDTVYPTRTTPAQSLNVFNGKNVKGMWQVQVSDVVSGDAGTLVSYQLQIAGPGASQTATTNAQGYYLIENIPSGSVTVGASALDLVFGERAFTLNRNATRVNFVSEPH